MFKIARFAIAGLVLASLSPSAAQAVPYIISGDFDISGAVSIPEGFTATLNADGGPNPGSAAYTFTYDTATGFNATGSTPIQLAQVGKSNDYTFSFTQDVEGVDASFIEPVIPPGLFFLSGLTVDQTPGSNNAGNQSSNCYLVGNTFNSTITGVDDSQQPLFTLNVLGTVAVPEIDEKSATLPIALSVGCLLLLADRRRRSFVA